MQERQFEAICQRILNAKTHIADAKEYMIQMKQQKPKHVSHPYKLLSKNSKVSHTRYQALSLELIPVYRQLARRWL